MRPFALVVDPDADVRERVAKCLATAFLVAEAGTLREAVTFLGEPVHVLITDARLPDGCGLSLVAAFKRRRARGLAMVMSDRGGVDGRARLCGADVIVEKPFSVLIPTRRMLEAAAA
ncbi:MAG: response regulator [Myxococcota bacterium]